MTEQKNKIPIKGYATFHKLKHCWIGAGFETDWFRDLAIYKNSKIMDPLKRIADETREDYETLGNILHQAGVKTHRSFLNIDKIKSLKNITTSKPPVNPRDSFAVIGEKLYCSLENERSVEGYADIIKQIDYKHLHFVKTSKKYPVPLSTAMMCRIGKDIWWDIHQGQDPNMVKKYKEHFDKEGYRLHISHKGYHTDGCFTVVKPGCIVSLHDIHNYSNEFPNWDVLYLPDQHWNKLSPFRKMKDKVGGRWWLKGEEHNNELINFVNTWLNDWVGYVEETVFDVNMLSIDENTIICNNYYKDVFTFFKKHKVEPIIFNFRHRYFWDGGVHCITQDLYREGTQEDYFG